MGQNVTSEIFYHGFEYLNVCPVEIRRGKDDD